MRKEKIKNVPLWQRRDNARMASPSSPWILAIACFVALIALYVTKTNPPPRPPPDAEPFSDPTADAPSEWTAFHHVCRVKGWPCGSLSRGQQRVLYTMRSLFNAQFTPTGRIFSRRDAIVIPRDALPVFDVDENMVNPMTLTLGDGSTAVLAVTGDTDEPQGLVYDTDTSTFEKLRAVLEALYRLYDARFLKDKERLERGIAEARERERILIERHGDLVRRADKLKRDEMATRAAHDRLNASLPTIENAIRQRNGAADAVDDAVQKAQSDVRIGNERADAVERWRCARYS